MSSADDTHEVFNQSPPFAGVNLFTQRSRPRRRWSRACRKAVIDRLTAHGEAWRLAARSFELGRIANVSPPLLRTHDPTGVRIDVVEFHPAYHALMRRSVAAGLHASIWDAVEPEASVRTVTRAAAPLHDGRRPRRPRLPDDHDQRLGRRARPRAGPRRGLAAEDPVAPVRFVRTAPSPRRRASPSAWG